MICAVAGGEEKKEEPRGGRLGGGLWEFTIYLVSIFLATFSKVHGVRRLCSFVFTRMDCDGGGGGSI